MTFASFMPLGPQVAVEVARRGRGASATVVLDRRDHRARGVLAARAPRARRRRASTSAPACSPSSCARRWWSPWPAPRSRRCTPTATSARRRHLVARRHRSGGTACPTATGRSARSASTSPSLRECLTGEKVDFAGDFYQVKGFRLGVRLGERRPKIVVGALNPEMLRAGRRGGRRRAAQLPARRRTCRGRSSRCARAATPTIYAYVHAGVCEREDGIELARRDLFSYAVVDAYAANFERAGFGDEVAEIRERHAAGDREGALAAVSRRMVDAIDVMGDADTVRRTMQAYVDAGVDVPILMPLPWGADRRQVIADTLRPPSAADRSGPSSPAIGEIGGQNGHGQASSSGTTSPSGSWPPAASQSATTRGASSGL